MFRAASPSQALREDSKSSSECSIWFFTEMHTAFHNLKNAESLTLVQLCFVLCGHKCLVTNGKHIVNVLVNKNGVCVSVSRLTALQN